MLVLYYKRIKGKRVLLKMEEENIEGLGTIEVYDINGLGRIGITPEVVFNEGINSLREKGSLIRLRDLGFSRIFSTGDVRNYLHLNGTYVRKSVIFYKDYSPIFLSYSILLDSDYFLDKAVEAHSKKTEFLIEERFYKKMLERAKTEQNKPLEERNSFIFKGEPEYEDENRNYFIPTNKLKEREITRWFYKDVVKDYGELLKEEGIDRMPIWFPKPEYLLGIEQPFLRQVWVCCLKEHLDKQGRPIKGNSGVSANNRSLHETSKLVAILKNK